MEENKLEAERCKDMAKDFMKRGLYEKAARFESIWQLHAVAQRWGGAHFSRLRGGA